MTKTKNGHSGHSSHKTIKRHSPVVRRKKTAQHDEEPAPVAHDEPAVPASALGGVALSLNK